MKVDWRLDSDWGRLQRSGAPMEKVRQSIRHEVADKDACCCDVRWTTFFGLQFQID
jgi:hypothetical protein